MREVMRILFLACAMRLLICPLYAQKSGWCDSLVWHANMFNKVLPQEKVYLHLDNTGYFIGERLCFKAYVISPNDISGAPKSGVLYVELLNPLGDVVKSVKLKIKDSCAVGDFKLDDIFISGFYEIRAYTRYMLNWGEDNVFSRVLPIFYPPKEAGDYSELVLDASNTSYRLDVDDTDGFVKKKINRGDVVRFFPESGSLVEGIKSRVAFEIQNGYTDNSEVKGVLLDSKNEVLSEVETIREGRGIFEYTPDWDGDVYLCINGKNKKNTRVKLPEVRNKGCVIRLDVIDDDSIKVKINTTEHFVGQNMGLCLMHKGNSVIWDYTTVSEKDWVVSFCRKDIPEGINEAYLFDRSGAVWAHRMFFIYPRKSMHKNISAVVKSGFLLPYKPVEIEFKTSKPMTNFSLAVRDADSEVNGVDINAVTWHLLSSDLKGYVRNAKYYLESDDFEHRFAADLLMLVQGWRKYDFEMMNGLKKMHIIHPAEKQLLLLGQLRQERAKNRVDSVELGITLYNRYDDVLSGTTLTGEKGFYTFNVPDCYGDFTMIMRTSVNDVNKKYKIGIDRNFSPKAKAYDYYETKQIPLESSNVLIEGGVDTVNISQDSIFLLEDVVIEAKYAKGSKKVWVSESDGAWLSNLMYLCGNDAESYIDEGEMPPSLCEWLAEKNKNFQFSGGDISGMSPYARIEYNLMEYGPSYKNLPIVWFVNNSFMFATGLPSRYSCNLEQKSSFDIVSDYFPVSIDQIKSVYISESQTKSQRFLSRIGLEDIRCIIIHVYTHFYKRRPEIGMRYTHFEGFAVPQSYVNPDYSVLLPEEDFRRTLYWNPNITTNKDGVAKVVFYNNGSAKKLVISAEGIDENGALSY